MYNDVGEERPSRLRRRRTLLVGAGLIGLGFTALWWQRAPIATQIIDHELARRGVPARYSIERLDAKGAVLAGLVIGDPAAPDLVARRVGVRLGWSLTGVHIARVRLENAWIRGTLNEKGLSLGTLDKLRPAPSGEPFTLPDIHLSAKDVRLRLATPFGRIGIAAEGNGPLSGRFSGRIALSAPRLRLADSLCKVEGTRALLDLRIVKRMIAVRGPAEAQSASCANFSVTRTAARIAARTSEAFDEGHGWAQFTVRSPAYGMQARASLLAADGRFSFTDAGKRADILGGARWKDLAATSDLRDKVRAAAAGTASTPLGPIARRLADALAAAMAGADGSTDFQAGISAGKADIALSDMGLRTTSGAQLTAAGPIFGWSYPAGTIRLSGTAALSGGGLPDARFVFLPAGETGWTMTGIVAPYRAGAAGLALSPLRLDWDGRRGHLVTLARIDGPLGDGAVRGLSAPLDIGFSSTGAISLSGQRGCLDLAFQSLEAGGLHLGATRLPLCAPGGGTLIAVDANGRLSGMLAASRPALQGSVSGSPMSLAADSARITLGGTTSAPRIAFALGRTAMRMKQAAGETRFAFARLSGAGVTGGIDGRLEDAEGALAGVPLLVDQLSGAWRSRAGTLSLAAPSARVRDAAADRRFEPVSARDIRLTMKDGRITGDAALTHPKNGIRLAGLTLRHDLARARGDAVLDVPKLVFGDDLQPEALTPLTLGIIANVGGEIGGRGHIRWSADGVTSDGVFETPGIGLSAAFGQVHNIKGRIVFDDLLRMTTPPGQIATIGEMNPGVAVKDGMIRYQLLPDQHVKVEGGQWPFSGGELVLEPTVLDFSKPTDRIFSLTVNGLDAAQFIQQFDFKNFAVTGLFDGRLPLLFNEKGGRIVGGRLVARKEGGTLAYVGEVSDADIGGAGKIAFDALKSLKYNALVIEMDGELDGEIISTVLFNGTNEAPVNPTGGSVPIKATGLPFKFNITVKAPFRSLLNTAQSFTDVRTTVKQAMPMDPAPVPGSAPVQPQDSRKLP